MKKISLLHPLWIERYKIGGIYDCSSNIILNVCKREYDLIHKGIANPSQISNETLQLLSNFARNNMLLDRQNTKITPEDFISNVVRYSKQRAIPRKLTLELTEDCNLRCKYCRYTINESRKKGRYHNSSALSYDSAVVAIDNYLQSYKSIIDTIPVQLIGLFIKRNPAVIGFYGGEVLLKKDLLMELISYSVSKAKELGILSIRPFVTTNGTLLTSDIIKFFVDNNVYLSVSLDGPQCENDKNRVYKNGDGSFAQVYKSLKYIQHNYPEYYTSSITIQAVAAPNYDTDNVNNFFLEMSKDNLYAGINSFIRLEFADYSEEENFNISKTYNGWNDENYMDCVLDKCISICETIKEDSTYEEIIRVFLFNPEYLDVFRMAFTANERIQNSPSVSDKCFNSCYIGKANQVLRANGEFHLCERTDYSMPIGSIEKGLDETKVTNLYREYFSIMNREECRNCWASKFCPICIGQLIKNSRIVAPTDFECNQIRSRYDLYLKILMILAHKFSNVFNALLRYFTKSNDSTIDEFYTYCIENNLIK